MVKVIRTRRGGFYFESANDRVCDPERNFYP